MLLRRTKRKAMLESEEKLVERFRAGDREALGQWLNMRRGPLLAFIERRLGTALRRKVDPDDLLQEVNTEAIRCFGEVDLSQREPFGWLCQIAERRRNVKVNRFVHYCIADHLSLAALRPCLNHSCKGQAQRTQGNHEDGGRSLLITIFLHSYPPVRKAIKISLPLLAS